MSNREAIDQMFGMLAEQLFPFIETQLQLEYGGIWRQVLEADMVDADPAHTVANPAHDVHFLLVFMNRHWRDFRNRLGREERSYVNELIGVRNKLAHDHREPSIDYTWRALDTAGRLLRSISPAAAVELGRVRDALRLLEESPQAESDGRASLQGEDGLDPVLAQIVKSMDELADELDLRVQQSKTVRKYRVDAKAAAIWIDPNQRMVVLILRTLALRHPEADVASLTASIARLTHEPRLSDQPRVPIGKQLVDVWPKFRADVLLPFFRR